MDTDNSIIYGLEFQARALSAQVAETETSRFLIGTQSLKQTNNQVHLLEVNENDLTLNTKVYQHPFGEIWKLNTSPFESNILSTCYNTLDPENMCRMKTMLLQIPDTSENLNEQETLTVLKEFDTSNYPGDVKTTEFNSVDKNKCATVVDNHILFYDIGENIGTEIRKVSLEGKSNPKYTTGKWYPHQNSTNFIAISEANVLCYDTRVNDKSIAWKIETNTSNHYLLRDVDINVNVQALIATAGDDAYIRLWDARKPVEPLYASRDHSHWVWCVRFNTFHDQLLLSSSSDARVLLSSVLAYSSEANNSSILNGSDIDDSENTDPNSNDESISDKTRTDSNKELLKKEGPLQWYEQHEDSVYCVEWSTADPWTFASLSYDGRLVINRVPKHYKYQILL